MIKLVPIFKARRTSLDDCIRDSASEMLANLLLSRRLNKRVSSLVKDQPSNFMNMIRVSFIRGKLEVLQGWSEKLLGACKVYRDMIAAINGKLGMPHPSQYQSGQHYLMFWLGEPIPGLRPLSMIFSLRSDEAYSIFRQVMFALAMAEETLKLNINGLHLMVGETHWDYIVYEVKGKRYRVRTCGKLAIISDISKSRLEQVIVRDGEATVRVFFKKIDRFPQLFQQDPEDTESTQHSIYQETRQRNGNNWSKFSDTNLVWIRYLYDSILRKKIRMDQDRNAMSSGALLFQFREEISNHLNNCSNSNCKGIQCLITSSGFQQLWRDHCL